MFDKEADNFDALIIATPDHTHAVLLMEAIRLNKHIYFFKALRYCSARHSSQNLHRIPAFLLPVYSLFNATARASAQLPGTSLPSNDNNRHITPVTSRSTSLGAAPCSILPLSKRILLPKKSCSL
jgi:hypothetical protein